LETRTLVRAHQGPVSIGFHSLHEQVRNPKGKEQVTSTNFLFASVFLEIQKLKNVSVPRLKVDSKSSRTLKIILF